MLVLNDKLIIFFQIHLDISTDPEINIEQKTYFSYILALNMIITALFYLLLFCTENHTSNAKYCHYCK